MRRLVVPVLSAGAIAAPIPVVIAQETTGLEFAENAVAQAKQKAELRAEARAAKKAAERRVEAEREKRQAASAAAVAIPPHLAAIAQCESGGNPTSVSADGSYRGLFQFDYGTWASVGGVGDPAAAPVAEQVKRAEILYARAGTSPWPVCSG